MIFYASSFKNQDKACSRELLLDEVWGMDVYVDYRIVDTYIKQLRKAIKPYSYIKTVFLR
ncbi:MAG: winged helix-turn-helix domain-containing protein [Clostridium sp.]|nr:MAG: winged helix-turn-helix domain-containing protein [Clostridium sp.]